MVRPDDTKKSRELRRQCHLLMDDVFGDKKYRYIWLKNSGYDIHMSNMSDVQLEVLKQELIMMPSIAEKVYKKKKK